MSDLRNSDDSTAATADALDAPVAMEGSEVRDGLRVDPPHHFGVEPSASTSGTLPPPPERHQSRFAPDKFEESNYEYDIVGEPVSESSGSKGGASRCPYGDPLLQARQIAEHLQKRYSELEHRERRLATQLTLLDQERRSVRMWVSECEAVLLERDVELVEREKWAETREASCLNLEHELQTRKAELLVREKEMQEIQARWRAEWERERVELQKELDQKRIELQNEQVHFAQTKETQLAEIQQERGLLLNRIRFQEEHLQKLRHDFEGIQNAFHSEKQRIQSHLTEMELQQSRRQSHLARYRQILEERDVAIQRQHILLAKARKAGVDSLLKDHQRMVAEQKDWQLVRNKQQQDMVKQNEMLRLNAENLEGRQQRLEKLRLELEETNRRTLEMRLVVEEACAQLAQAVGPESATQRIESAQFALSDHYRHAREQISSQRQELEQFMGVIAKQRDDVRSEQQALAEWISKRDEELRLREANVRQEQAAATSREQAWQNTREGWMLEKLEAEAIIRDLLKRLESETETAIAG
jgi:hypothetical protein